MLLKRKARFALVISAMLSMSATYTSVYAETASVTGVQAYDIAPGSLNSVLLAFTAKNNLLLAVDSKLTASKNS